MAKYLKPLTKLFSKNRKKLFSKVIEGKILNYLIYLYFKYFNQRGEAKKIERINMREDYNCFLGYIYDIKFELRNS